jgi:uncharacterized protein YaaR (DUF327 family)
MKVDRSKTGRSGARESEKTGGTRKNKDGTVPIPFVQQLSVARERMSREQLDAMLAELDDAGTKLFKNPSRENLDHYKNVLQKFMRGAVVLTFSTTRESTYHRRAGFEQRIVHKIDEALKTLTDAVLAQNRRPMRILEKIGEIRGLLVDAVL